MRRLLDARDGVTLRAYGAVLAARLYGQRAIILYCCVAAAIGGVTFPRRAIAAVVFCVFAGVVIALEQRPGRLLHLDRCEQSAPVFGRELARAKALVPCLGTAFAALIFALAASWRGAENVPLHIAFGVAAAIPATLIALCATVRHGVAQVSYIALAVAAAAGVYVMTAITHSFLAAVAFCAIAAFLALRQYGEALARFDPV